MSITNLTNLQVGMADLGIGENDKLNRAQMPKRSSNASGSSSEFSLSDVSSLGASPTGSSTSGFSKREDWETINLIKDESFAKVLLHHLREAGKLVTKYSPRNSSILHTKHIFSKEIIKENNELACKRSRALFFVYQIVILIMM
jgi:hypothetical protein